MKAKEVTSAGTTIEVKFSRDDPTHPTHYRLALKANPTSLLTGQNVWPAALNLASVRHEMGFLLAWPAAVLMAISKAAKVGFQPTSAFRMAMFADAVQVMNIQFAGDSNLRVVVEDGLRHAAEELRTL